MIKKSPKSLELYKVLMGKGYRAAIIQKKEMEATQASWNQMMDDGIFK